jgi:hypothetical protein
MIPIGVAAVRRGTAVKAGKIENLKPFEIDHLHAFVLAMSWADKYLRQYCGDDVSQITAEDHQMRRTLKRYLNIARNSPLRLPIAMYRPGEAKPIRRIEANRVERLADEVHFIRREGSPLLQVADACAYGFGRFFSNGSYGESYLEQILGKDLSKEPGLRMAWEHYSIVFNFDLNFPIY